MNFFDAKLVKDGNGYYVDYAGTRATLAMNIQEGLAAKGLGSMDVILAAVPSTSSWKPSAGEGTVTAHVDVSEMMGSEVHLHVGGRREGGRALHPLHRPARSAPRRYPLRYRGQLHLP